MNDAVVRWLRIALEVLSFAGWLVFMISCMVVLITRVRFRKRRVVAINDKTDEGEVRAQIPAANSAAQISKEVTAPLRNGIRNVQSPRQPYARFRL